jgi:hypothetical protein
MRRHIQLLAAGLLACMAVGAQAGLDQSQITNPGGFVQAAAGPDTVGSHTTPGANLFGEFNSGNFSEQSFSGNSLAAVNASYSSGTYSNASWGQASLGTIKMWATNNAPNNSHFAKAATNGGFKDTVTVDKLGYTGQSGLALFDVHVDGTLNAAGFAGSAAFWVAAYKNNAGVAMNASFNRGNSDAISVSNQMATWGVSSAPDVTRTVNGTVTFAIPVIFGQAFSLGIYGYAEAGMRSSSGVPGNSTASLDFTHTVTWGGLDTILVGGERIYHHLQQRCGLVADPGA